MQSALDECENQNDTRYEKIAVFGKPGGGKSTLSKQIAMATGIQFYPIDLMEYQKNGERVPLEEFHAAHKKLINSESWIVEGLGTLESFWSRVDEADTLVYVDLPYWLHYWWVTKRLLLSAFIKPEGWPDGCSVLKGTLASWKYLRLSPKFWTPEFFKRVKEASKSKQLYRIRSIDELNRFVGSLAQ